MSAEPPLVVILGATSGVARALAAELCRRGRRLMLCARDLTEVRAVAADLTLRYGAGVQVRHLPEAPPGAQRAALEQTLGEAGEGLEGVILCIGAPPSAREPAETIARNLGEPVALLEIAAAHLAARGRGYLCALSSVAGDRGRRGNYVYGAAKGGLNVYLDGLRARLFRSGVRVITIKLGPVDTRMSYGLPVGRLAVSPEAAARTILRRISRGAEVAYVPGRWRPIMLLLRMIPEWMFRRLPV